MHFRNFPRDSSGRNLFKSFVLFLLQHESFVPDLLVTNTNVKKSRCLQESLGVHKLHIVRDVFKE